MKLFRGFLVSILISVLSLYRIRLTRATILFDDACGIQYAAYCLLHTAFRMQFTQVFINKLV